jgi:hypothetical protein
LVLLRSRRLAARVLGARHLVEAVMVGARPTRRRVLVCAAIDAVHAVTLVAVGVLRRDRQAWVSAAAAVTLGAAAWRAARDV